MPEKIYKQLKRLVPHCSDCKEKLMGNGSIVSPYYCRCGEWETDRDSNYRVIGWKIKKKQGQDGEIKS